MSSTDAETIFVWHQVARVLARGSGTRVALPIEVILWIFALADCTIILSYQASTMSRAFDNAGGNAEDSLFWFTTPPLTKGILQRLQTLQLHTSTASHYQEWAGDLDAESWTLFEVSIKRQPPQRRGWRRIFTKRPETSSEPYRWVSPHNPIILGEPQNLSEKFEADHELLSLLQPNDKLTVGAHARFSRRHGIEMSARLEFQRRFEPLFF